MIIIIFDPSARSMPIQRIFLDWHRPALAQAAEFLIAQFAGPDELDLSRAIVVVPGGRAERRLLEILVERADERGLMLTPPEIVTPDRFPELIYLPKRPFADARTQQLAWVAALKQAPAKTRAAFLPSPPEESDTLRWLAIGETLRRLHTELAADGLNCESVLEGAAALDGFAEHKRWKALCELQRRYHNTLDQLQLWDKQSARVFAIKNPSEIATEKRIILVGTVDLNRAQRQMLDQIADQVTALVFAPAALQARFDEHGCLVPDGWKGAELPLTDEQIERVDGPADQAEAVTRWLASLGGKYRADEIAIGLPDERLAPQIERQLAQVGLRGRSAIGQKIAETGPYRLLKCAADYAAGRRFRDLAALVRHPDVYAWLIDRLRQTLKKSPLLVLENLDRFASKQFPARIDAERLEKDPELATVLAIHQAVEELIAPLDAKQPQPLHSWAEPLLAVLATIYGSRWLNRAELHERYLLRTLEMLREALESLGQIPEDLDPAVDARRACRIVLDGLAAETIPPPADPEAIELLGWLDLPLDDSPAALVTTFNDGWIPSASTADALLPNRLREALGLMHNDRRLARDAYALSLLCASRRELRVLVAHRDPQGNPLAPSRLLFLTEPERVVARARRFFGEMPAAPPRRSLLAPPAGPPNVSRLAPPRPAPADEPPGELSVTQFRDYLACPYRFYLRHVLKLEPLGDDLEELDGGSFGDLVHLVLEQFGRSEEALELRTAADEKRIAEYLDYQLDRVSAARFGTHHARPAVRVQLEQLRIRLHAFAHWQAGRAREGWQIVFSENSESRRNLTATLAVDGAAFTLRGRIDRIDYHESLGRLAVLDYKTADRGQPPEKTHRRGDAWIDLQLPLYRHLVWALQEAGQLPRPQALDLGYIVLPLDTAAAGLALAEWDESLLQTADALALEIIRAIRQQRFWPPVSPPPEFSEDFAAICQDRRLGAVLVIDE